jgi:hypothetical protein
MFRVKGSLAMAVHKKISMNTSKITGIIVKTWKSEVNRSRLSPQARTRYSQAIKPYHTRFVGAYVRDYVAILLEKGWDSFDMKAGLLKGALTRRIPVNGVVRTVSAKSKPDSWVHPGFRGAGAVEKTKKRLLGRLQSLVSEAIK